MNRLEILERLKIFTEDWASRTNQLCGNNKSEAFRLARMAYFDFKSLKTQIEKSLDEEAEGLLKQEQRLHAEAALDEFKKSREAGHFVCGPDQGCDQICANAYYAEKWLKENP